MTLASEFFACKAFTVVFMAWLGIMGVLAFAWEMFRHE